MLSGCAQRETGQRVGRSEKRRRSAQIADQRPMDFKVQLISGDEEKTEMSDTKKAEVVKAGENFYFCSECKNASNKPEGIPHSKECSLADLYAKSGEATSGER